MIEREELIRLVIGTGLADLNCNGELEKTDLLDELKRQEGTIQLEEIEQYESQIVVDLFTKRIQPRAIDKPLLGIHTPADDEILSDKIDGEKIFREQFNRFKACSKISTLKKQNTRLYRINSCDYEEITTIPFSLNIFARNDSFKGLQIESSSQGFDSDSQQLIDSSGLLGHINGYLDKPRICNPVLSLEEYCMLVDDPVLGRYQRESYFDIEKYLCDREQRKTGYGSSETRGIVGALYLEKNRSNFLSWVSKIPKDVKMSPAFWWPSSDIFWGSSIYLDTFFQKVSSALGIRNSSISLMFPSLGRGDEYKYIQRFGKIAQNIVSIENAKSLDNMELFVLWGDPCWAMVQYHVNLKESLHFKNISIPIGYITYDPVRVEKIVNLLRGKLMDGYKPRYIRNSSSIVVEDNISFLYSLFS